MSVMVKEVLKTTNTSVFPLSHSENTFQDTCSEQQGKGAEGVSLALAMALGDLSPSGSPIMGSTQLLCFLQLKILKEWQKYWKSDC